MLPTCIGTEMEMCTPEINSIYEHDITTCSDRSNKPSTSSSRHLYRKGIKRKLEQWPCCICENKCVTNVICCNNCDTWFHFKCARIKKAYDEN